MDLTQDYFQVLGLSQGFDVDTKPLSQAYRQLQRQFHPDKFANKTAAEQRLAEQFSAYLNTAYQTLKKPVSRAEYLLQLAGNELNNETLTIKDGSFLMMQMEWREQLAEMESQAPAVADLMPLQEQAEAEFVQLIDLFKMHYQSQDFNGAAQVVAKLHFVEKFKTDISRLEERLTD